MLKCFPLPLTVTKRLQMWSEARDRNLMQSRQLGTISISLSWVMGFLRQTLGHLSRFNAAILLWCSRYRSSVYSGGHVTCRTTLAAGFNSAVEKNPTEGGSNNEAFLHDVLAPSRKSHGAVFRRRGRVMTGSCCLEPNEMETCGILKLCDR